jgi:hypothetical protein
MNVNAYGQLEWAENRERQFPDVALQPQEVTWFCLS